MSDAAANIPKRISVDLGQIDEIARKGIRRAAVFMGLGVNAANAPELTNYQLTEDTAIHLLPNVPPEVLDEWKQQFRLWVVSCGFRELVDSLCKYLDQVHIACYIAVHRKFDPKIQKQFEYAGLSDKLLLLQQDLGVTSLNAPLVQSFYPIRNCLVHRLGRVGPEDTKDGQPLRLRYRRMEFVHTSESGKVIDLPDLMDPKTKPFALEEAGALGFQYRERTLDFARGSIITFTPKELTEVLFFTNQFLYEYNKAVLDFATHVGAYTPPPKEESDPKDVGAPQSGS
jgi:hypothetical protein